MDLVMDNLGYQELKEFYNRHFSLGWMGKDFSKKMALVGLVCYITEQAKSKKPDVTHYQIIRKLSPDYLSEAQIKGIAVVCEDFAYGCRSFPDFGVKPKDMPSRVKELLTEYLPF